MTKDEAMKLALEAGFRVGPSREGPDDVWGVGANLERFAKLVEEKERKACAEIAEKQRYAMDISLTSHPAQNGTAVGILNQIRARGQA